MRCASASAHSVCLHDGFGATRSPACRCAWMAQLGRRQTKRPDEASKSWGAHLAVCIRKSDRVREFNNIISNKKHHDVVPGDLACIEREHHVWVCAQLERRCWARRGCDICHRRAHALPRPGNPAAHVHVCVLHTACRHCTCSCSAGRYACFCTSRRVQRNAQRRVSRGSCPKQASLPGLRRQSAPRQRCICPST